MSYGAPRFRPGLVAPRRDVPLCWRCAQRLGLASSTRPAAEQLPCAEGCGRPTDRRVVGRDLADVRHMNRLRKGVAA